MQEGLKLNAPTNTYNFNGISRQENNLNTFYNLERDLKSLIYSKCIEAIDGISALIVNIEDPILINTIFLKLADVYQNFDTRNQVKKLIATFVKKHQDKLFDIINKNEVLKRIAQTLNSNDVETRIVTLQLLSYLAALKYSKLSIYHQILHLLSKSKNKIEIECANSAIFQISKQSPKFALHVLERVEEIIVAQKYEIQTIICMINSICYIPPQQSIVSKFFNASLKMLDHFSGNHQIHAAIVIGITRVASRISFIGNHSIKLLFTLRNDTKESIPMQSLILKCLAKLFEEIRINSENFHFFFIQLKNAFIEIIQGLKDPKYIVLPRAWKNLLFSFLKSQSISISESEKEEFTQWIQNHLFPLFQHCLIGRVEGMLIVLSKWLNNKIHSKLWNLCSDFQIFSQLHFEYLLSPQELIQVFNTIQCKEKILISLFERLKRISKGLQDHSLQKDLNLFKELLRIGNRIIRFDERIESSTLFIISDYLEEIFLQFLKLTSIQTTFPDQFTNAITSLFSLRICLEEAKKTNLHMIVTSNQSTFSPWILFKFVEIILSNSHQEFELGLILCKHLKSNLNVSLKSFSWISFLKKMLQIKKIVNESQGLQFKDIFHLLTTMNLLFLNVFHKYLQSQKNNSEVMTFIQSMGCIEINPKKTVAADYTFQGLYINLLLLTFQLCSSIQETNKINRQNLIEVQRIQKLIRKLKINYIFNEKWDVYKLFQIIKIALNQKFVNPSEDTHSKFNSLAQKISLKNQKIFQQLRTVQNLDDFVKGMLQHCILDLLQIPAPFFYINFPIYPQIHVSFCDSSQVKIGNNGTCIEICFMIMIKKDHMCIKSKSISQIYNRIKYIQSTVLLFPERNSTEKIYQKKVTQLAQTQKGRQSLINWIEFHNPGNYTINFKITLLTKNYEKIGAPAYMIFPYNITQ